MTDSTSSRNSRIKNLEEQVAFLDNHIAQQDQEILAIRNKLEKAIQELKKLRAHFDSGALSTNPPNQKPPHY